jgi:hypothetical protein
MAMSARIVLFCGCLYAFVGLDSETSAQQIPQTIQFNRDVRPILSASCYECHGPDSSHREAELRFDQPESATANRDGHYAIKPGDVAHSELWSRVNSTDADVRMPPPDSNQQLTSQQVVILKKWIEQGAKYQRHWSLIRPQSPDVPGTDNDRVQHPIDAFILAGLNSDGPGLSTKATKEILIRRVTFDLTGLPPTPADVDTFVRDQAANAFENVVDRLLASDAYGERMALMWMDAARYGDTSVFHADGPRDMWPWRDWVIEAYNSNKSFKDFTIEQLAGDLLPNSTIKQKIASGFNRNHGTTDEGGAIDEEYRVEYAVDRVKTMSMVWLGLTLECAQCHDHKYDPLTQREYYQMFAFFNQASDKGMQTRNGNAEPKIDVPNFAKQQLVDPLRKQIDEKRAQLTKRASAANPEFQTWLTDASENAMPVTVPQDAFVLFTLDEGKGRRITSTGASKVQGNIKGKPKWKDGHNGKCLELDSKTYVDVGSSGDFERTDAFSYGAWLSINTDSGAAPIARMDNNHSYRGWDLHFNQRYAEVHIVNTWPANAIKVRTKNQIKSKQWQHVFVTYDGSSKAAGVKIYFDGVEQEWTIEQNGLTGSIKTDKPLYLGRRNPDSPFKGQIDDVRIYTRRLAAAEVAAIAGADPIAPILALKPGDRSEQQVRLLKDYFLSAIDQPSRTINSELSKLQTQLADATQPISSAMVMKDVETPRMTYVLDRGHYASPKKDSPVEPGTPAALPAFPQDAPRNRLGLAQWLTDPQHPLTARVTVNRYWQMLFGTGLVKTAADFGAQGEWPSHPELLDWLAADFVRNGWDVKRTLKQMVMSAAYRQSSRVSSELLFRDPENRLISRGPRFRLQGEFIRDNALAISGLLVNTIGGPGVKPYQPPGLWNEVSLSGNVRFKQDKGGKLYRRSMYTYWKRSSPAPAMLIFDTPTREKCVVRRDRTNTPLQALVTLNDPQYVEAARVLAERMMKEGGKSIADRIRFAYRLATARQAKDSLVDLLTNTYRTELKTFQSDGEQANALLAVGEHKRDETLDAAEHAAWTIIASLILNLDETLTRG